MQKQLMALKPVVEEYENKREVWSVYFWSVTGKCLFQEIYPIEMNW